MLGNLRGQVSELQSVLVGLNQQVAAEQALRRADVQAMDYNVRNVEAQLLAAQDQLAKRAQVRALAVADTPLTSMRAAPRAWVARSSRDKHACWWRAQVERAEGERQGGMCARAHTQDMVEHKSSQFAKAMQDLEAVTAQRDEETRLGSEQQLSTVVRATAKKDKAGVERMMVIEGAVRDVATASALALAELQVRVSRGSSALTLFA